MPRTDSAGNLVGEQGLFYKDGSGNEVEVTPTTPLPVTGSGTQNVAGTVTANQGAQNAGNAVAWPVTLNDGQKATYSAAVAALAPAAAATDVFVLGGSATKTVRVTRCRVSGIQTTGGVIDVVLVKRSSADIGGTSTAPAIANHDSADGAATATVAAYTANPVAGASAGTIRADKTTVPGATGQLAPLVYDFGGRPGARAIVLRGVAQQFAVNLNGQTVAGGAFDISVEWTEE